MKKAIYALVLPLVLGGLVFANRKAKNDNFNSPKPPSTVEKAAALKQWEATPEGIKYKEWESSPTGKRVYASEAKIRKEINAVTDLEAVVTSLSLPPGSRLGFGVMVRINGDDYILGYGPGKPSERQQLDSLNVADKIIIRSHAVSHAPKYAYSIIWLNYVERDGKIIYKRAPTKGGC